MLICIQSSCSQKVPFVCPVPWPQRKSSDHTQSMPRHLALWIAHHCIFICGILIPFAEYHSDATLLCELLSNACHQMRHLNKFHSKKTSAQNEIYKIFTWWISVHGFLCHHQSTGVWNSWRLVNLKCGLAPVTAGCFHSQPSGHRVLNTIFALAYYLLNANWICCHFSWNALFT